MYYYVYIVLRYLTRIHSSFPEPGAHHIGSVSRFLDFGNGRTFLFSPHRKRGMPEAQRRAAVLAQLSPSGHGRGQPTVVVP